MKINKKKQIELKNAKKISQISEDDKWHYNYDSLNTKYGNEISLWIISEFKTAILEIEAYGDDNHRICRIGNKQEEKEYKNKLNDGCCGFEDRIIIHPKYGKFKIGFNYGH